MGSVRRAFVLAATVLALGACSREVHDGAAALSARTSAATPGGIDAAPPDRSTADPGVSAAGASGAAASTTASPAGSASTPPYTRVVLAAGVRQYLHCRGTGSPTVVVVADLVVPASSWTALTADVEAVTRTCVYDRPGIGTSPPRTSPHQVVDAGLNARELSALLTAAGQPGPYLLVGQGYGTLVARAFARQHPALVQGLLLGGDAPATDGSDLYWTEAGHRIGVAASTAAAGPTPTGTARMVVSTEPYDEAATLAADLPGLLHQLAG